jgi:hypothetical protein
MMGALIDDSHDVYETNLAFQTEIEIPAQQENIACSWPKSPNSKK